MREKIRVRALIDTGADISIIPSSIAYRIGAWHTNQQTTIVGVHGKAKMLPLVSAYLYFPFLNNKGGKFIFAMNNREEPIVGMDILRPIGITINTKTHQLSIKNEVWEAFKTLAAVGVIVWGGIKLFEALSKGEDSIDEKNSHS